MINSGSFLEDRDCRSYLVHHINEDLRVAFSNGFDDIVRLHIRNDPLDKGGKFTTGYGTADQALHVLSVGVENERHSRDTIDVL